MDVPDSQKPPSTSSEKRSSVSATRTIPMGEVEAFRREFESLLKGQKPPQPRVGTVQLSALDDEDDDQPTCDFPVNPDAPASDNAPVERQSILPAGGESAPPPKATHRSDLELLFETLEGETLHDEPSPHVASGLAPQFDSIMRGGTLEVRVGSPFLEDIEKPAQSPLDQTGKLSIPPSSGRKAQELPNAFRLSDQEVGRAFLTVYRLKGTSSPQALVAVGRIARLEHEVVEHFVDVGRLCRHLLEEAGRPEGHVLRSLLQPTGLLDDVEVLTALQFWVQGKHDVRFFADDDARRLKPARLVGAHLLRRRWDKLSALVLPSGSFPHLERLRALIRTIRIALEERQRLIRKYFPEQAGAFSSSYLVQRGLNARPGFFWSEQPCEPF